jgi:antibiotic biosynthesis monooxygenase (ABM) superfamily enzyme
MVSIVGLSEAVLLTYLCLPALSKLFAPWLFARTAPSTTQAFEPLKSEERTL